MVNGWRRAVFRLGAATGIAGPVAFTGAWIASSRRQTRQGPGGLQLSGLAAADARDPWIMFAGFLVAGGCTVALGAALRRDHLLLNAPGEPGASWHGSAHDAISGLVYVNLVAAELALAWRFGRDPAWRQWRPWLLASAAATGVILIAYATDVTGPAAATWQRAAVTLPQAAVAAIAARLMWRAGPGGERRLADRHALTAPWQVSGLCPVSGKRSS